MLRVLVACERNGWVRDAFRDLGHDAWSCDLEDDITGSPYHIKGDALAIAYMRDRWDLMIAHPPCTYLSNSGVRWLYTEAGRWEKMRRGAEFFSRIWLAPIPMKCIENPIMHRHAKEHACIGPQTQVIQPWQHGHRRTKATALWLHNLPPLVPSLVVGPPPKVMTRAEKREWHEIHLMSRSKDRGDKRSVTYEGIAVAMAAQWGITYDTRTGTHRPATAATLATSHRGV